MTGDAAAGRAEQLAVAALVAALVAAHAFWGGAYDLVVRAELGIVAWWLLAAGVLAGVLPRVRIGTPARLCLAGLVLVGAVTAASLGWTSSAERTTVEIARVVEYVGVLALLLCVIRRETLVAAVTGLAVAMVAVLVGALVTRLAPGSFADPVRDAFGINRLSAPLNYWNGVSAWGAMSTALLLGLASSTGSRWRGLALGAVPLAVVVTYLTYSRAGVIGTALGVAAVLVLADRRLAVLVNVVAGGGAAAVAVLVLRGQPGIVDGTGSAGAGTVLGAVVGAGAVAALVGVLLASRVPAVRMANRRVRTTLAIGASGALIVAAVLVGPGLAERAYDSFDQDAPTASASDPTARLSGLGGNRRNTFASAIAAGDTEPLRGIGGGTFELWWNRDARDDEYLRDAHNLYLETWAEYGIIGSLALTALGLAVLLALWRARRRNPGSIVPGLGAVVVVYAFHAGVDWMWELSAVTVAALVGLAVLAAGVRASDQAPPRRWAGRGAVAVVALLAVAVQLPAAVSLSNVRKSQAAVRAGDLDRARVRADDAVASSPWAASPLVQRALVSEAQGALEAADTDLRRAARRERYDWRVPFLRARVLAKLGRPRQAVASFERARALRPLGEATNVGG